MADMAGLEELKARLRTALERAEPLPWCWEQCGEKEDCPVVGVAFDGDGEPQSGQLYDHGDEIIRWNIASDIGSGIDSRSPSANADFIVEAVNAVPALLTAIEQLEAIIAEKDAALEEEVRAAYIAGATDVHVYWRGLTGTERPEPDFAEAAGDYASFRAAAVLERKPDVASN